MKRIYTLTFLLLIGANCNAQFFQEDFSGVTINYNQPSPSNKWTMGSWDVQYGNYFEVTKDGKWYCEGNGLITIDTLVYPGLNNNSMRGVNGGDDLPSYIWFTSPWINCSGQAQVYLTFANMRAYCGPSFSITIYDSLNTYSIPVAGATTPNIATFDTVDISAYAANKSKIAFDFTVEFGGTGTIGDWYTSTWIVDDVSLYNPSCSINNQVSSSGIYNVVNNIYTKCVGDSIKLYLTQPQSTQTFQWYLNGNAISGAIDSMYYALDSGLYSCKITDTCGYVFTKDLDVKEVSPVTLSPTISCTGDLIYCPPINFKTITAGSLTDPYTYQWYNNGVLIPNQNNYWLNCTQLTPYYAIITTACGSYYTDTVTISQGITPNATITSAYPFPTCYPTPFTLNAFDSVGYSFQWQMNNVNIPGQTNNFFTDASDQSYSYKCIVTHTSGCSKSSNSILAAGYAGYTTTITAQGPTSFCIGDSVVLSADSSSGNLFQWLYNSTIVPLPSQIHFTASQAGSYSAYITNDYCTMLTNNININIPCVGSGSIPPPEIRLGKNSDETTYMTTLVDQKLYVSSTDNILSIVIYNDLGKLIASEKLNNSSYTFNTSALNQGMYFVAVQTSSGVTKSKFIVAHSIK